MCSNARTLNFAHFTLHKMPEQKKEVNKPSKPAPKVEQKKKEEKKKEIIYDDSSDDDDLTGWNN